MALNREQKRQLKKSGDLGDDGAPRPSRSTKSAPRPVPKEQRTGVKQFGREVRGELRKVAWPTRQETINYSVIVGLTLAVLTSLIFVLDWAFSGLVLRIFSQ
jgi:preprotein translocase subunit SecE